MPLYETHCHTRVSSICGVISPEEVVSFYKANGYAGVFITDHFFNGNCVVNREMPDAPYAEKVHRYCESYRQVKAAAKGEIDVFFGFEYSYGGTDVLVYGWDEDWLAEIPEIMDMPMRKFIDFANENGAFTVQAHPFREAAYIDHIRLYTNVAGVEIYNAGRDRRSNSLAETFAEAYGKIKMSGSDLHSASARPTLGGVEFDEKIRDVAHFIELCKAGKARPVVREVREAPEAQL